MVALIFGSCGSTGSKIVKPEKVEVIDFDIRTAEQMVEKGDKIIADISVKDTVSRQEYDQFLSNIADAYDGYEKESWKYMFFYDSEFEDEKLETLHLNKEMFYPTLYHKDVEVVSAKITNTYYKNEHLDRSILVIREEYSGKDKKLVGWYREYCYQKNEKGEWIFSDFGGQVNFLGDGFKSDYLELK
jgi:hypothetical protein